MTFSKRQNYSDGKQTSGFARGCGWKAGALWDKGTLLHPAAMHVLKFIKLYTEVEGESILLYDNINNKNV